MFLAALGRGIRCERLSLFLLAVSWRVVAGGVSLRAGLPHTLEAQGDLNTDFEEPDVVDFAVHDVDAPVYHFKVPGGGYDDDRVHLAWHPGGHEGAAESESSVEREHRRCSAVVECLVALTCHFFLVYGIWFTVQILNRCGGGCCLGCCDLKAWEKILHSLVETVFFVPMLCVLFFAVQMRAFQLGQGYTRYLPQPWVQLAMLVCTWSLAFLTFAVLLGRAIYRESWEVEARRGGFAGFLSGVRRTTLILIYLGFACICIGAVVMRGPKEVWGEQGGPPVSPAVICTIMLATLFFTVYFALACLRLVGQLVETPSPEENHQVFTDGRAAPHPNKHSLSFTILPQALRSATSSVAFVPMLCILFIVARLRALQIDPVSGNPHVVTQGFFYACTVCVFIQAFLQMYRVFADGHDQQQQLEFMQGVGPPGRRAPTRGRGRTAKIASQGLTLCVHLCTIPILVAIYTGSPTRIGQRIPQLPSSIRAVVQLAVIYFLIQFIALVVHILKDRSAQFEEASVAEVGPLARIDLFFRVRAKEAVAFCPMFSVLFLAILLEAATLSAVSRPPTWCVKLEYIVVVLIGLLAVSRIDAALPRNDTLKTICNTLQYVLLFILYCVAFLISAGLFAMTGEEDNPNAFRPVPAKRVTHFG